MKSKYFNGCYLLLIQVATRQKSNVVDMNNQIQLTGVMLDSGIPILVSEHSGSQLSMGLKSINPKCSTLIKSVQIVGILIDGEQISRGVYLLNISGVSRFMILLAFARPH